MLTNYPNWLLKKKGVLNNLVFRPPELGCVLSLGGRPQGGSTILDNSPYGNNGTITGATWVRLPRGLWAQDFDGTDDRTGCGKGTSLSLLGALTIEAWIYPDVVVGSTTIMGNIDSLGSEAQYLLRINAGFLSWYQDGPTTLISLVGTTAAITASIWQHVRVVRTSATGTITLYVNDVADATTATSLAGSIATEATRGNTSWGKPGDWNAQYLNGKIALGRIYNAVVPSHFNRERHLFGV